MATKVVLSKLSPTMEEGLIVKWTKNEGDTIKVGDVLAEVETDKANMEMEALAGHGQHQDCGDCRTHKTPCLDVPIVLRSGPFC